MSTPVIATPLSLAMARSPLFITGKNNTLSNDALNAMSITVSTYTGVQTPVAGETSYTLSKTYSIDEVINFEVSDLVMERLLHPFGKAFIAAPSESETGEAVWVRRTGDWTYSNAGSAPEEAPIGTQYFLASDGWIPKGQPQLTPVTQMGLALNRKIQVLQTNYQSLGALYNTDSDLNGVLYSINGTDYFYVLSDELGFSNTNTTSTQQIIYIPTGPKNIEGYVGVLPTSDYSVSLISDSVAVNYKARVEADGGICEAFSCLRAALAELGYEENSETYEFELVCEPKYTPYLVQFVNRYGVSDYITFFKRSDERGNFTQDSYQKSIYADGFTDVNYIDGKYQSFNVNSRDAITLNTGFLEESYGEVMKDILMSEQVAIYENSQWMSIVPQRGSIEYQKHVNQKLINYTLTFDYGFDERMNIR